MQRLISTTLIALLSATSAHAVDRYWDGNNTAAGFGTASGSWLAPTPGPTPGWGAANGTTAVASVTTTTSDNLFFGNGATGLAAGTITVGTVSAANFTFATGSGAIVLSSGTITLAAAQTTTVNNATNTINSILAGAATSFTKAGAGTLILTGVNSYTGSTILNAGTLNLGGSTAAGSLASTVLTLSGGTLNYTRTGNTTQDFTTTNINAGPASAISVVSGNILNLGTVVRGAGGALDFSSTGAGIVAALAGSNDAAGIMSGFTFGNTWAVANGAGVAISGLSSYTLTSTAGTAAANYTGFNIDVDNSAGTIGAAITANSLRFSAAAANTMTLTGAANVITSGGILVGSGVGANLSTITGGTLAGANTKDLSIIQNNAAGGLTISSIIGNNTGATALIKSGAGLLTLSGNNTFTGGMIINAGTVALANTGALFSTAGSENAVTFGSGSSGTLALTGTSLVVANLSTNAAAGSTFVQNANGSSVSNATLTVGNSLNLSGTYAGIIRDGTGGGTLALIKAGTGTLTLPSANTYSGGTTLSAGTVVISNATSLGAATGAVNVTGGSRINATGGITYANAINVGAALTMQNPTSTASTATFSGVLSGNNAITVANNGTNNINATLAFTNPANTFTGNVILPTTGSGNDFFSFNSIGDGGNFTIQKNGNREGIIYTGSAAITFNTRQINIGTGFGNAAGGIFDGNGATLNSFINNGTGTVTFNSNMTMAAVANNGVLFFEGTNIGNNLFAGTIGNPTSGGNLAIGKSGAGTWLLSGANSYAGNTLIFNGTLSVNAIAPAANDQPLGKGSLIIIGHAANGILAFTGSSNSTTDKQVQIGFTTVTQAFGGSILNNGSGSLTFTNSTFNPSAGAITATRTLTLGGTHAGTNEIQGTIQNNAAGGLVALTVSGSTWALSGNNSYTGGTNVNGGTLLLKGAVNVPATGTLAVNAGGNFSLADGTVRNTTAGTVTIATGANLSFDWDGGAVDNLAPTVAVAPAAAASVGIIINPINNPTGTGLALLTGIAGSTLNNPNYFLANNTNFTATLTKPGPDAGSLTIGDYAVVTALTDAYWKGGLTNAVGAMAFSTGTDSNWFSTAAGAAANGVVPGGSTVNVIFGATGGSNQTAVTTGANMTLGSITFNDTSAVTIAGSNTITLNSTSGTAASTTAALETVTAGSAISVTPFANVTNTISARLLLGANQTWNVASGKTLTVSAVSGSNSLTKADAGTLILSSAAINYTGATIISAGTLNLVGVANFTSPTTVNPGATLRYTPTANASINNAAATVNLQGAMVYNPAGNFFQTMNGAVTANATSTIDVSAGGITSAGLYLDGGLLGSAGVTVTSATNGVGLVLRTPASTYSGTLTVNGNASAVSGTGSGLAINGLVSMSSADLTINGTLELGNRSTGMGWAGLGAGPNGVTLSIDALNGNGVVVGNMQNAASTRTLSVGNNGGTGNFSGVIANGENNTLSFIKAGVGTQTLSGLNTFTGNVSVDSGTLAAGVAASGGNSALGASNNTRTVTVNTGGTLRFDVGNVFSPNFSSTSVPSLNINGGTVTNTSPATNNALGNITLAGGTLTATTGHATYGAFNLNGTITSTGVSTISSSDPVNGRMILTSSGANGVDTASSVTVTSGTLTISAPLADLAVAESKISGINKLGAGTLVLSGANTFTGATTVSAGTLAVASTGTLANIPVGVINAGSTFAVQAGSGTVSLGNSLTVGAGASLNLGIGAVFSMVDAAAGGTANLVQEATFATSALTLNGAILNFELGGASADKLALTGALATASLSGVNTINLTPIAALTAGTYDLITTANPTGGLSTGGTFAFASGLTSGVGSFGGTNYLLTLNNAANSETVTVAAAPSAMTWTGQTLGNGSNEVNWNTTASNWAVGTTPVAFVNGYAVTFQDTNTVTAANVTSLAVTVQPSGVSPSLTTFDNTAVNYTVGGGAITGTGALTKSGTGTVTLSGPNTYSGNTTVSGGILEISGAGSLYGATTHTATVTVATGAQITLSGATNNALGFGPAATWDVSGTINSTGGSAQTLPGNVMLNNGTLAGASAASFGTFYAGAARTITANGATNTISAGNVGITTGINLSLNTPLLADALSVSSVLGVTGQLAGGVTKTGLGTVTLSGANIYTGTTTVSEGTLTLTGNRTAATTGGYTVSGAGTQILNIQNGTYGIGNSFVVGGGGTATVAHSAGTISSVGGSGLIMGNGTGGTSTSFYNLSGTGSLTVASIIMGTNSGLSAASPHTSTIAVSDTGALTATTLRIGRYDVANNINTTNTFTQTGGTTTITTLGLGGNSADAGNSTGPVIANLNLSGGIFSATTIASLSAGGAATALNANSSVITIGGTAQVTLGAFPTFRGTNSTATITFDTTTAGIGFLTPAAASTAYMPAGTFTNAYLTANGVNFNVPTSRDITIGQLLENATAQVGTLTKSGIGTLTLTGANTYTGTTTISASGGTLQLGNGSALGSLSTSSAISVGTGATFAVNQSDTVTQGTHFSSAAITGDGGFTQAGPGTTVLNLANGYTGGTAVNAGTLQLAFGGVTSNIITTSSALTMGGGTLQLTGTGTQTLASLTTTASTTSNILLGANQTLTFATGAITIGSGSLLNFNTAAGGANGATVGSGLVVLTTSGYAQGVAINSGLTVTDAGGFGLATVNASDQVIRLTGGTLLPATGATSGIDYLVDNNTGGGGTGSGGNALVITPDPQAAKSITVDTTTASGILTLDTGAVLSTNTWNFGGSGTNTYLITGGASLSSIAPNDAISVTNFNAGVVTFASPILANGTNNVSVLGTGTTVFSGTNNYTGTTTLAGGILNANTTAALGDGSATNTLIFNGGTLQAGGSFTSPSTRPVTLTTTGVIDTNSNDVSIDGIISGAGGLTKNGLGTLTLTALNDFTGAVAINAGTLVLTPTASGNRTMTNTLTGSGTLNVNPFAANTSNFTSSGNLSGFTGTVNVATSGNTNSKLVTSGASSFGAGTIINVALGGTWSNSVNQTGITVNLFGTGNSESFGALRLDTGVIDSTSSIVLKANASIGSTGATATGTINAPISEDVGPFSLTKQGLGTIVLNGVLSNSGGVTVSAGTLTLGSSSSTYTGATVINTAGRGLIVTANGALGATGPGNETTVTGAGTGNGGALGFSGGINYTATEKIIGSGAGHTTGTLPGFTTANRGFIQSVSGSNTFAGDIELSANGTSRIGTQDGAQLTLTGAITQATGITTADILFRVGNNAGDFVTLSNAGNSFGGNSTVFTGASVGNYAGVRLGINNGLPTNLTISGFSGTGAGTALNLAGYNQSLNGLITGVGGLSIINTDTVTPSTLTLNPTANQVTTNTLILGGGGLGVINVVKEGAFSQTFSGANTHTGNTTVNAGTLSITHNSALGTTLGNSTTINGSNDSTGSILSLSAATTALTLAENINFAGNATGRAVLNSQNANIHLLTGNIDVTSDTNIPQFTVNAASAVVATAGGVTLSGDIIGTFTNGATGLLLRGSTNSGVSSTNTIAGNINLTGGGIVKTDANTWTIGAAGKTYTAPSLAVAVGTLKMGVANYLQPGVELTMGNLTGGSTGNLDLNGFSQTVSGIIYNGAGASTGTRTITSTAAAVLTVDNATAYSTNGGSAANSVVLTGAGLGLTKKGIGTLTLSGANTYTGATTVSDGTLQVGVAGIGGITATSSVTVVKTGATYANAPILSGSGTIGGAIVIGDTMNAANKGILAPGDAGSSLNRTLTSTGSLTVAAGSQVLLGITSPTGTDASFVSGDAFTYLTSLGSTSGSVVGSAPAAWFTAPSTNQLDHLALGGTLTLGTNLVPVAGQGIVSIFSNNLVLGTLAQGQIFNLMDWAGLSVTGFKSGSGFSTGGIHGDFDLPDISSTSFGWDTSAFASHGVIAVVVVPEPSRALFLLLGLLSLMLRRRRRAA